jgi:hypothetical protein
MHGMVDDLIKVTRHTKPHLHRPSGRITAHWQTRGFRRDFSTPVLLEHTNSPTMGTQILRINRRRVQGRPSPPPKDHDAYFPPNSRSLYLRVLPFPPFFPLPFLPFPFPFPFPSFSTPSFPSLHLLSSSLSSFPLPSLSSGFLGVRGLRPGKFFDFTDALR